MYHITKSTKSAILADVGNIEMPDSSSSTPTTEENSENFDLNDSKSVYARYIVFSIYLENVVTFRLF